MKLYIKQKVFSWNDKFSIYDENAAVKYYVEGDMFALGKKLHLFNVDGTELAFIHQKVFSFLPRFFISMNGSDVAEMKKEFSFAKPIYTLVGPGWRVTGNFLAHDYRISKDDRVVARITKKWFAWSDTYEVDIEDDSNVIMALSAVLIIDAVLSVKQASVSTTSTGIGS